MRSDQSNSPPEPDSTRSPLWIVIFGHLRFPAFTYENLNTFLSFKKERNVLISSSLWQQCIAELCIFVLCSVFLWIAQCISMNCAVYFCELRSVFQWNIQCICVLCCAVYFQCSAVPGSDMGTVLEWQVVSAHIPHRIAPLQGIVL